MKRNAENNSSKRKAIRISLLVLSLLLLAGAVGVSAKYIMEKQVQGGTIPANTPGEENTPDLQVNPNPNDPLRTEAPSEKPTKNRRKMLPKSRQRALPRNLRRPSPTSRRMNPQGSRSRVPERIANNNRKQRKERRKGAST